MNITMFSIVCHWIWTRDSLIILLCPQLLTSLVLSRLIMFMIFSKLAATQLGCLVQFLCNFSLLIGLTTKLPFKICTYCSIKCTWIGFKRWKILLFFNFGPQSFSHINFTFYENWKKKFILESNTNAPNGDNLST